ncbi:MAG: hypothetical protein C0406_09325 [Sideroxydans sp.]|nr:hypothetical protein [Sideroxydans sp.]
MSYLKRTITVLTLGISATFLCGVAEGAVCQPSYQPPPQPFINEVYKCLSTVIDSIKSNETSGYDVLGERLVIVLLTTKITDYNTVNEVPWERVAQLVGILNSQSLIDLFVKTIGAPRDGEETDSAYAQLYAWQAPKVLFSLGKYNNKERASRIDRLAWAIVNEYGERINPINYKRLPIGSHLDLLDAKHPLRPIAKELEKSILGMLKGAA